MQTLHSNVAGWTMEVFPYSFAESYRFCQRSIEQRVYSSKHFGVEAANNLRDADFDRISDIHISNEFFDKAARRHSFCRLFFAESTNFTIFLLTIYEIITSSKNACGIVWLHRVMVAKVTRFQRHLVEKSSRNFPKIYMNGTDYVNMVFSLRNNPWNAAH